MTKKAGGGNGGSGGSGGNPSDFREALTLVPESVREEMYQEILTLDLAELTDIGPFVQKLSARVVAGHLHPTQADAVRRLLETYVAARSVEAKFQANQQIGGPLNMLAQIAQDHAARQLPTLKAPRYVTYDEADDDLVVLDDQRAPVPIERKHG
jgi:hypothetical protein